MFEREERDGVAYVRMTHGRANAWDVEFVEGFRRELDAAASARTLVITARGRIFCAGVDLPRLLAEGEPYVRRFLPLMGDFVRELFALPIPVLAAVNGHAIAGGGILALASDYVLMADTEARIGVPELTVGVPFPAEPLEVVRFALSGAQQRALVNLGRTVQPAEAVRLGLVDELVAPDALEERTHEAALHLAAIPAASFRLTKRMLRGDAVRRMERLRSAHHEDAVAAWSDPATHAHLRAYLARALGSGTRNA